MSTGYLSIYHLAVPLFIAFFRQRFVVKAPFVVVPTRVPDGHRLERCPSQDRSGQMNTSLSSLMTARSISHLM